jgi:hypothetical protein
VIILKVLGHLWTLPNTMLGMVVGVLLTRGVPRRAAGRGFLVFSSGRGISKHVQRAGPGATTFGAVVVFWDPEVADHPGWLDHEAVHVRQYLFLGPLFIPIYLAFLPFTGWRAAHPLEYPAYKVSAPAIDAESGTESIAER